MGFGSSSPSWTDSCHLPKQCEAISQMPFSPSPQELVAFLLFVGFEQTLPCVSVHLSCLVPRDVESENIREEKNEL